MDGPSDATDDPQDFVPEAIFPDLPPAVEAHIDRILNRPRRSWKADFDALALDHPDHRGAILGLYEMFAAPGGASLDQAAPPAPSQPQRIDPTLGTTIGPYSVIKALGEGGMGTVYLAEQSEPVRRRVALKVIKAGMDSQRVLSRFELERQALALMSHENIAKVYDAGTTGLGQPFFVMEYVPGLPLARHCDRFQYTIEQRLQLFLRLCAGVQHAHHKGIIHRDLKPANVLVSTAQDRPIPKIIDFGLARATSASVSGTAHQTHAGFTLGTPEYMSPEQAGAERDVDTRTDVYSLGVMLYELLTGVLPFASEEIRTRSLSEIQEFLESTDTPRPSARLTSDPPTLDDRLVVRRTSLEHLAATLRSDLDWIVLKAMNPERGDRYSTPSDLGADIQRYLRHEPVEATPPSTAYRIKKYWRRHRLQVSAGVIAGLAIVGGGTGTVFGLLQARDANDALTTSEATARRTLRKAETYLSQLGLLELGDRLAAARDDEAVTAVAWPENARRLRAWVDERGEPIAAARVTVMQSLDELRQRALRPPTPSQPAEYSEWNDSYLDRRLSALRKAIEEFSAPGALLDHMRQRAAWAESIARRSVDDHRARWDAAIAAIRASDGATAHERYERLELAPQVGLVPVGMDPDSKLWEFVHLRSSGEGPIPERGEEGALQLSEDAGIVFVLVPGGRSALGAAPSDPRNPDPMASADDGPSYEVNIEPFFLAKHELTQAQWKRLTGKEPSALRVGTHTSDGKAFTWRNPVEQVSWFEADAATRRFGLRLPTEQEWESACRAGASTPWSHGAEPSGLDAIANLSDRSAAKIVGWEIAAELDDGYLGHAPVGSFDANAWGFHDMHGNVCEWCKDAYGRLPSQSDDGELAPEGPHIVRGGAFSSLPATARCSARLKYPPGGQYQSIGVRPARSVIHR